MKKSFCLTPFLILVMITTSLAQDNRIIINADQELSTISRHIYGHFVEHLGEGIYGGVWVGEDSGFPIRKDTGQVLVDRSVAGNNPRLFAASKLSARCLDCLNLP